MNIGLLCARYAPEFEGGSERVVRALARGLFAAGHAVRVVAGTDRALSEREVLREEVDGLPVARVPLAEGESFALGLERPRVDALVARLLEDCDVAHVHHWSTLSHRLVRTLAPRAPVVVTLHDAFASCPRFFRASPLGLDCPPRGEFATCGRCLAPLCAPLSAADLVPRLAARGREFDAELAAAARWIAPSEFHAGRLRAWLALDRARGRIVPAGLTRSLPRAPRAARPPGERGLLHVLHFGNLCAEKGTFDIVKAMALLGDGRATLTLAGRALAPGFESLVRRLARGADVRILGGYDAGSLAEAAARADLAVFPSRLAESYGLVLDEAHALGLPAWVSAGGAPTERLVDGELALPAGDPEAWSRALRRLAEDPAALEPVRRRVAALAVPGVEESVRAHEAVYRDVLAGAPGSAGS